MPFFVHVRPNAGEVPRMEEYAQVTAERFITREVYRPASWLDGPTQTEVLADPRRSGAIRGTDGTDLIQRTYHENNGLAVWQVGSTRSVANWQLPAMAPYQRDLLAPPVPMARGPLIILARPPARSDYLVGYRQQPDPEQPGSSAYPLGYG